MSTPSRGLDATLYLGATQIGLLLGITFEASRPFTEFSPMGTLVPTDVLLGVQHHKGSFRKAFVDHTYGSYFTGGSVLTGSLVPRSGKSVVGTVVITGYRLLNMEAEQTDAVEYEGDFVMYVNIAMA